MIAYRAGRPKPALRVRPAPRSSCSSNGSRNTRFSPLKDLEIPGLLVSGGTVQLQRRWLCQRDVSIPPPYLAEWSSTAFVDT
jgi:hypothetical protein